MSAKGNVSIDTRAIHDTGQSLRTAAVEAAGNAFVSLTVVKRTIAPNIGTVKFHAVAGAGNAAGKFVFTCAIAGGQHAGIEVVLTRGCLFTTQHVISGFGQYRHILGRIVAHIPNGAFTIAIFRSCCFAAGCRRAAPIHQRTRCCLHSYPGTFGNHQATELGRSGDCRVSYLRTLYTSVLLWRFRYHT